MITHAPGHMFVTDTRDERSLGAIDPSLLGDELLAAFRVATARCSRLRVAEQREDGGPVAIDALTVPVTGSPHIARDAREADRRSI
jgi:hypothetical protein